MEKRRRVTEEDLHVTEALIAESFGKIKQSVLSAPRNAVQPATSLIREHPFATAATAAGAGLVAYELIRLVTPRVVMKEISVQPQVEVKEAGRRREDMTSQLLALATPYLVGYLQQYVGRMVSGERR